MAAGLQIFNASGALQFDTNLSAMSLMAKGTTQLGGVSYTNPSGVAPLIAWRPQLCNAAHTGTSKNGSTWTFHFEYFETVPGYSVPWWVFDRASAMAPPTGVAALEIRDGAGGLLFHSHHAPLRMLGFGLGTVPAGKQGAIVGAGIHWQQRVEVLLDSQGRDTGKIVFDATAGGLRYDNGTFYNGAKVRSQSQFSDTDGSGEVGPALLVDVTNV